MTLISKRLTPGTSEYESTRQLYTAAFPDISVEPDFDYLYQVMEKISADVFSYTYDGEYAGYTIMIPGNVAVYYYMIAVSPAMRSKGVGGEIASQLKKQYEGKSLLCIIEADDDSPEGKKTMERRLSFHAKIGLKPTGYHMRILTREYAVLSTADPFVPEDLKDIAEKIAATSKEMIDEVSLFRVAEQSAK